MNSIEIYQAPNGEIAFRGDVAHETIWASLDQIAILFNRDKSGISRHIKNIFNSGELERESTVAKIATVQKEGERQVTRGIEYYNLDMILSIGYRVDSKEATVFRRWATSVLKRYLVEGRMYSGGLYATEVASPECGTATSVAENGRMRYANAIEIASLTILAAKNKGAIYA